MLARYGRGQSLTAGRRIRRSPQRSAQRINLLSVGFGPVQPLQFTGRAGAVCSGAGRAAEGADVVGSPPGCHLLDKHLRSMLLDLLLAALADRGEPAALLLGLPEFFLLLPAFGRCGTAFETAQKVSQACFQGPPCAVAAGVPGPVPTAGRRTQFEAPVELVVVLGHRGPRKASLPARLLSGRFVRHLGRPLSDGQRERVPSDDDDHLLDGLAATVAGAGLHLMTAAFRLGQKSVHDPQRPVGLDT